MAERYFITAIHTDSGKTLVSTIFAQALHADYWKPIQAGFPRDADAVAPFLQNPKSVVHQEAYLLQAPMSPHAAARLEGVTIHPDTILLPETENTLIIEGAGGVLVPINDTHFMADLMKRLDAKIIVVANLYLGSINHTLLTMNELKRRKLPIEGIVFNNPLNDASEQIILHHTQLPCLLRVRPERLITQEVVNRYALELLTHWPRAGE